MNKIDYNRKMIGKTVKVASPGQPEWVGIVEDVKDEEILLIREETVLKEVSIFDIRST
jgi:RNase P/RNase MRP subunit p29